jgi:hypothetical protein
VGQLIILHRAPLPGTKLPEAKTLPRQFLDHGYAGPSARKAET